LVDIASKGGNLLLNVGPTAEGLIPDSSAVRLAQIGRWMKMNGESVYGTSASPFFKLPWGRCTQRLENGNTTLYLHVFDWPGDQVLRIPGLDAKIQDVYLLTNPKQKFAWKFEKGDALIHAPSVIFDAINTVIVVKIKGKPEITSNMPALTNGVIELPAEFADIHNPGYGTHARVETKDKKTTVVNWTDSKTRVEWMFNCKEPGIYAISAVIKAIEPSALKIKIADNTIEKSIPKGDGTFKKVSLGEIAITNGENSVISFNPVAENWHGLELTQVELAKK